MIPIRNLFEAHLTVRDLDRSMAFYGDLLGLPLARVFPERKVAFYWIGAPGNSMLGVWEAGASPQRLSLHVAFTVDLPLLLGAPEKLRGAGVTPLDFWQKPALQPVVLVWMPAAACLFSGSRRQPARIHLDLTGCGTGRSWDRGLERLVPPRTCAGNPQSFAPALNGDEAAAT